MLAGVKFIDRSEAEKAVEEDRKALKKQRKKEKKEKKKRRQKEKKADLTGRHSGSDSDSGPDSPLDDPTSAPNAAANPAATSAADPSQQDPTAASTIEREDWMTKSFPKAAASAEAVPLPGAKPGDTEEGTTAAAAAAVAETKEGLVRPRGAASGSTEKGEPSRVGDGGASWRLKALARAKQQASDASNPNFGRRVGDIVSEQWGSLAELTAGLTDTRAAHAKAHLIAARERQAAAPDLASEAQPSDRQGRRGAGEAGSEGRDRGGTAHYLHDVKSSKAQMKKPSDSSSLSWRRSTAGSAAKPPHPRAASVPDDPPHASRGRSPDPQDIWRDTRADRSSARPSDRHADRDTHSSASGADNHSDRQGTRHHRRDTHDGPTDRHYDRAPPRRGGVNPNSKQAELLAFAASDMNAFRNDGSFMEQFAANQSADQSTRSPAGNREPQLSDDDEGSMDESERQRAFQGKATVGSSEGNQGAAAALRARLNGTAAAAAAPSEDGNKATAAALRARLMGLKQPSMVLGPSAPQDSAELRGTSAGTQPQTVELSAVDSKGRAVPGAFGRAAAGAGAPDGGRKPKRLQRFEEGERQRYFADDDKQQLKDLVAQQRYEGATDMDANLADNILRKGKRFREKELDVDEEYDVDGGLDMYESRKKKGTKEQQQKRDRSRQIADHRRGANAVDRCSLCFSSVSRPRHLTISLGQTAYLALPARGRLVEGHSIIVPTEHVASTRQVDDHIWTELRNFKKCLLQMHMAQGMDVIFMETAMRLSDARCHAVVDCIPVPPAVTAKAPLYFKKGIDDAESEWSQHHAKRMIETGGKGLRGSIPANFPYFHVEFNLTKGFVHVIDDEAKFDSQFGRSIMIGLLDLPAEDMHRRAKVEDTRMQQQWVADFAKSWDPYDWTKQLG
ncbi:hypothetical protein ABBQ38_012367 [Trebouxia sp. C0009 RCD-2024]